MAYTYLASPYSHKDRFIRADRYRMALKATADLMAAGEVVFCPVAYGHSLEVKLHQNYPYEYWVRWSRAMLAGATRLYVLTIPGWAASAGVAIEVRLAHDLGIPVSGYAHGLEAEDISGIDIMGNFGISLPRRPPKFTPVPQPQGYED